MSVDVVGGGGDWKLVAIPEYRLAVSTSMYAGACGANGDEVRSVEVGTTGCLHIALVNAAGANVTADIASTGSIARVEYQGPTDSTSKTLNADWDPALGALVLERAAMGSGDHLFRPMVQLRFDGKPAPPLWGGGRTIQSTSQAAVAEPASFDLGAVTPGDTIRRQFRVLGNFESATGQLVLPGLDGVPDCIDVMINDEPAGATLQVIPGQSYALVVKVAPFCGNTHFERDVAIGARIDFDVPADGKAMPAVALPVTLALDAEFALDERVEVQLTGGESADAVVSVRSNASRGAEFDVIVEPRDERVQWPAGRDLSIGAPTSVVLGGPDGSASFVVPVSSTTCCGAGTNEARLVLRPREGSAKPIELTVVAGVAYAGVASCWGRRIGMGLGFLLLLALLHYLYRIRKNSIFISTKILPGFVPLTWSAREYVAKPPSAKRQRDELSRTNQARLRREAASWGNRLGQWLKASPWSLGWFSKRRYRQCMQIVFPARATDPIECVHTHAGLGDRLMKGDCEGVAPGVYLVAPATLYVLYHKSNTDWVLDKHRDVFNQASADPSSLERLLKRGPQELRVNKAVSKRSQTAYRDGSVVSWKVSRN